MSLSPRGWVSPGLPLPPRLCLGAWHTLAVVLPPPVSCSPGMLPPLVYRSWKNPLASLRPGRPRGGEEAGTGVGAGRRGQPRGAGPGAGEGHQGVQAWVPTAVSRARRGIPAAAPGVGRSLAGRGAGGTPSPLTPAAAPTGHPWGSRQPPPPCLPSLPPPRSSLNSKCVWALPRACTCLLGGALSRPVPAACGHHPDSPEPLAAGRSKVLPSRLRAPLPGT